jgi:hypothetical protein
MKSTRLLAFNVLIYFVEMEKQQAFFVFVTSMNVVSHLYRSKIPSLKPIILGITVSESAHRFFSVLFEQYFRH